MNDGSENPAHILVVEDDAALRKVIVRLLESDGHGVAEAGSVLEAEAYMASGAPIRVILLDIMMPEQDGYALLKALRAQGRFLDTKILILTSLDSPEDCVHGLDAGADDYLRKPYNPQELLARVRALLRQHDLQKAIQRHAEDAENALREQKRLAEELACVNARLEAMSETKNKFIGTASHDLRSPLTNVKGYCELLLSESLGSINEEQRESLQIIMKNCKHVLELLTKLLNVSRIDSGDYALTISPCLVGELLASALSNYTLPAQEKGITLHVEDSPETMEHISCDEQAMHSMLENLIGNAVKFCKKGDTVTVRVRGDGEAVVFEIEDTGPGIHPEERKLLFKRFSRLSNRPTGGEKSVGLGLAIVRELAELHGGSVSVESEWRNGSTFRMRIPRQPTRQPALKG